MNVTSITEIASLWDISIDTKIPIAPKVTRIVSTMDEQFILKKQTSLINPEREIKLLHFLTSKDINVQLPLLGLNSEYVQIHEEEYYCMYRYIEGHHYTAIEALQDQRVPIVLSEILASLHKEMQIIENATDYPIKDIYHQVYGWAVPTILTVYNDEKLQQIYDDIHSSFKELMASLPKQLIHRDAHLSNIIMNDHQLSGIIDFEIVEVNVRIFDICYCSTSILNEVFSKETLRDDWLLFVMNLVKNYTKYNLLSEEEVRAIPYVMLAIQSIFMAYFVQNASLYETNKQMFLWIYEHQRTIESKLIEC
jgi:Ser/Thr protein kinase RdoA (MazF antagonist)